MQINFTVDTKNLAGFNASSELILRAANMAMTRALDNLKSNLARETVSRYYVKASDIRKSITAKVSTGAGIKQGLIISRAPRLNLSAFKISPKTASYRMKGRQYRAAVKRDAGLKGLAHNVFYIPKRKKMYKRITAGGRGFQNLRAVLGPAIPQMLKNEQTFEVVTQKANEVFTERLNHEVKRLLFA